MISCVITVAGFTAQIRPPWRRAKELYGVDHLHWLMFMHKESDILSPNYKRNEKMPLVYLSVINFMEFMQLTAGK